MLQRLICNFSGIVRNDKMEGRDYLVVPMIMMVEGVHAGSNGPLYYPKEEIKKIPQVWNHKPVVVYHPSGSACDPDILTNRKIGIIMNTRAVEETDPKNSKRKITKLKAEAWLEPERIKAVDERVGTAIENNEVMELSTGLFTENEEVEGEWNGEKYNAIARNYRPDHLALLPDQKGACSVADGAGFLRLNSAQEDDSLKKLAGFFGVKPEALNTSHLTALTASVLTRNELGQGQLRDKMSTMLREKMPKDTYGWIEEVFSDYFIYSQDTRLFKQSYSVKDDVPKFEGIPEEVVRVTQYKTVDGNVLNNTRKETQMNKEKLVNDLIANAATSWKEEDRATLMAMDEKVLERMVPVANTTASDEAAAAAKKKEEEDKKDATKNSSAEPKKATTVDEFISNAPAEFQDVLRSGLSAHKAEKTKLIDAIVANKRNIFTKPQLEAKNLDELKGLAALAAESKPAAQPVANYAGQGDAPIENSTHVEEPLETPVMNFDPPQAK